MGHGQALRRAVGGQQVDTAAVGELRNGQPRDLSQRGGVVERRAEHAADLGQEPRAALGRLGGRAADALALQQVGDGTLGAGALETEGGVVRDRGRQVDLLVRKRVHGVVVQHELAEQPSLVDERDEGQRADALAGDDVTKGSQVGLGEDVGHEHRRWILVAHRPRRVALHGRAVPIGQAAPGLEAHDAVGVEDQQAGAPGAGGRQHGVDRCLVDLGGAARPADERGETVERSEHLQLLLAVTDLDAHSQAGLVGQPDVDPGRLDRAAVLRRHLEVEPAGLRGHHVLAHLLAILRIGVALLHQVDVPRLFRRPADDSLELAVEAQHLRAGLVHGHHDRHAIEDRADEVGLGGMGARRILAQALVRIAKRLSRRNERESRVRKTFPTPATRPDRRGGRDRRRGGRAPCPRARCVRSPSRTRGRPCAARDRRSARPSGPSCPGGGCRR